MVLIRNKIIWKIFLLLICLGFLTSDLLYTSKTIQSSDKMLQTGYVIKEIKLESKYGAKVYEPIKVYLQKTNRGKTQLVVKIDK